MLESPLPSELRRDGGRRRAGDSAGGACRARRCAGRRAAGSPRPPDEELLPCRAHRCYKKRLQRCAGSPCGTAHRSPEAGARTDRGGPRQLADRGPARRFGADRARTRVRGARAPGRREPHPGRRRGHPARLAGGVGGARWCCWSSPRVPCRRRALRRGCGRRSTQQMRSAGGWSGAWVDDGSGRVVFEWKAGTRRVPASVQKLVTTAAALDRLGPEARFETAVRGRAARSPRECWTETSTCAGRATPASAPPPCAGWPRRSARPAWKTWAAAYTGTRASSTAAAAAPASGSRPTSGRCPRWPSTADRCCRWLGDGRAIPPRSWPAGCASRCDRSRSTWPSVRAPAVRLPTRSPWPRQSRRRSRHWSGTRTTCRTTTTPRRC